METWEDDAGGRVQADIVKEDRERPPDNCHGHRMGLP